MNMLIMHLPKPPPILITSHHTKNARTMYSLEPRVAVHAHQLAKCSLPTALQTFLAFKLVSGNRSVYLQILKDLLAMPLRAVTHTQYMDRTEVALAKLHGGVLTHISIAAHRFAIHLNPLKSVYANLRKTTCVRTCSGVNFL